MPIKSDKQLIQSYLDGDELAMDELVKKYLKPIYTFAYRNVGNSAEAEDIAQEVFIKVWKNIKKIDPDRNFKSWIFTIAKNTSIDFLRKKKSVPFSRFENEKGQNLFIENIAGSAADLNEILNNKQVLAFAKDGLSKEEKKIINLYHTQGYTFREISDIFSKSINTVKSRYRRAIFTLKEKIKIN